MSYRVISSQNQAARLLGGCTPSEVANDAIAWFDTLQADADSAIDRLIDRIIKILRSDERMPRLTAVVTLVTSASRPSNRTAIGNLRLGYAGAVHLDASSIFSVPTLEAFRATRRPPERHSGHN
jgi:hypothetical protein